MTAPEFPDGLEWLNTSRPLKLQDLRGKVVLLDFWTYCCINCMHIIPDLKRLEEEFPHELVVIGVHSAKFTQERETANIRNAILRYEITHPVVNDRDFAVWRIFQARAWPTLVLIDPEGKVVMTHAGEGAYERFAEPIRKLAEEYSRRGSLNRRGLALSPEQPPPDNLLAFPGKVAVDPLGGRLFVSDQNHHRVLICRLTDGKILDMVGAGRAGLRDGSFEEARFNHPQGMALVGGMLYVADTDNHAIREIDLGRRQVTTLAGNGKQAPGFAAHPGRGDQVELNSPWDLAYADGILFVAMAGMHQIWTVRVADGWCEPFAGTGREGLRDGQRSAAWLAQPSGLALGEGKLYFADSEVSSMRFVDLTTGQVGTLVGEDLFEFGDMDGTGSQVRLQHPLGVAWADGRLWVADTYNSKIKLLDVQSRRCVTAAGTGKPGYHDGNALEAQFNEPGGIAAAEGKVYIADTNNHLIRVLDPRAGTVNTLILKFPGRTPVPDTLVEVDRTLRVGAGEGVISLEFEPPEGFKLNPGSQVVMELAEGGGIAQAGAASHPAESEAYTLPVRWTEGMGVVYVDVEYTYCSDGNEALCRRGSQRLRLPVLVASPSAAPDTARAVGEVTLTVTCR